jgi:KUP system potassium uptake protein
LVVSENSSHKANLGGLTVGALGVVFGDIGTSPLYTLKECLHSGGESRPSEADLYGVLSLIFWALTMVVTVKYLSFIMKADNRGEGGIFALLALVPEELRTAKPGQISLVALFAVAGAALLYGDGVITPAISVLSAVEGLAVANPSWAKSVVPLSCAILLVLFVIQRQGTGTVGKLFGPIMIVWFTTLGVLGLYHITFNPEILLAISPHYAWAYFAHHGWSGFHILASVVLAVTGGEALYADMGHFGVKPIRWAWFGLVFPSLILGYFGQGAHGLRDPSSMANPFFSLVPAGGATIALVILSSVAAVIASQALISGVFSLTRQGMQLGFFPRVQVLHTAHEMEGQIYVPEINYLTGVGCILLVLMFRESSRLAAAFGIAVAGTMTITSAIYYLVVRKTWRWPPGKTMAVLLLFLAFDIPFVVANLGKFADGGYVPVFLGAAMLAVMIVWNRGRTLLAQRSRTRFESWESALSRMSDRLAARVPGTAVFMNSNADMLPVSLVRHVERSRCLHETVILLTVRTMGRPMVPAEERYQIERLPDGFYRILMHFGFMEEPKVMPVLEKAVRHAAIPFPGEEVTYYLGRENFLASAKGHMGVITESLFSFLQKNAVAADRFFGLPPRQVVELGTQMDL